MMFIFNSLWQMIVFGVKSFLINPLLYYGNGIYGRTSSYFMNVPKIPEVNLALLIVNYLYVPKFRLMLGRGPVNLSIFMNNFFFRVIFERNKSLMAKYWTNNRNSLRIELLKWGRRVEWDG